MKSRFAAVAIAASLLASTQTFAADHVVKMQNAGPDGPMSFSPGFLKVEKGDTVTFKATDPAHNSVSVYTPAGAEGWKGAMSQDVTVTLNEEGVYIYQCDPHVMMAMVGVVQVGAAGDVAAAQEAAKGLNAKFVMSKDRLDGYMSQVK